MNILVINGPNLNLLGKREVSVYGDKSYKDIENEINAVAKQIGANVQIFQSNHEGEIIDKIHNAMESIDGIIINPAAYTHTSIAIRDALASVRIPTIEVHLSNIHAREDFRHKSFIAPICIGQISGFGSNVYKIALHAMADYFSLTQ